ncbi:MAG: hypothetical protein HS127_13555 [Planctomycetia bacterium]|nr:hypothetical protein [Planctomycetia bacterium]
MLAWSTVWRWLRFFGSLKYTLRNAFDLIRQADPNSPVFAKCFPFTTESIKQTTKTSLDQSIQLFSAEPEYHRIFGHSFFPELATKSGWS